MRGPILLVLCASPCQQLNLCLLRCRCYTEPLLTIWHPCRCTNVTLGAVALFLQQLCLNCLMLNCWHGDEPTPGHHCSTLPYMGQALNLHMWTNPKAPFTQASSVQSHLLRKKLMNMDSGYISFHIYLSVYPAVQFSSHQFTSIFCFFFWQKPKCILSKNWHKLNECRWCIYIYSDLSKQ